MFTVNNVFQFLRLILRNIVDSLLANQLVVQNVTLGTQNFKILCKHFLSYTNVYGYNIITWHCITVFSL